MHNFEFEYPFVFVLLVLIFCIYKCPLPVQKITFPHTQLFANITNWLNKEKLLYSIIFALLVTALASPISYDAKQSHNRKGRDLVFLIDTSGSMGESGYSKEDTHTSKFEILKNTIRSFIEKRYDDNVGISVFGSYAFAAVPLSYDMHSISFLLDFLEVGIAGENTAIGDGILSALRILQKGEAKNKVIILMTDGYQNSGTHSIKEAVEKAKKLGVKIYTIGLGENGVYDAKLLQKIATQTDAKMFQATNAQQLQEVYDTLDALEPSPIRSQHYLNKTMLFTYPLAFAMLLLLYLLAKRRVL